MSTRQAGTAQVVRAPRQPKPPKPMSAAQRDKLAKQGIVSAISATDEKAAIIAALEAVYERLASDTDLGDSVRQKYREITALPSGTHQGGTRQKADLGPVPVPIRSGNPEDYNPYGKFDPYQLIWEYGAHQLRAVLARGTQQDLREAVGIVESRNPGARAPRGKNADMIEYILRHVAGPGY
jgi:hypothetical protein